MLRLLFIQIDAPPILLGRDPVTRDTKFGVCAGISKGVIENQDPAGRFDCNTWDANCRWGRAPKNRPRGCGASRAALAPHCMRCWHPMC